MSKLLLSPSKTFLHFVPLGHVPENQDCPCCIPAVAYYGSFTGVDRHFTTVSRQKDCVIGQSDNSTQPQHFGDGVVHRLTGHLVDDPKHLLHGLSSRLGLGPSGKALGRRIHERNCRLIVCCDHRVTNTGESGGVAALAFLEPPLGTVLIDSHLDNRSKLGVIKWFQEVTERLGYCCPSYGLVVRICGQKYDG